MARQLKPYCLVHHSAFAKRSTKQWSLITVDRVGDMALQLKAWTTHSSRGLRFEVQGPTLMSCDLKSLKTPVSGDLYP